MNQSKIYSLVTADWVKGFLLAVIGALLAAVQQGIATGGFSSINWSVVGTTALSAGIAYILKQFFTDPEKGTVFGVKI